MTIESRAARSEDVPALARLKIEWAGLESLPDEGAQRAYAVDLLAWMQRAGDRVVCRIAVLDERLIGMAWLVVFDRVPDLLAHRGQGVGRALVDAVCTAADALGVPRVTVHSSVDAVRLYESAGFWSGSTLLERRAL